MQAGRESLQFWNLVRLILETLRYFLLSKSLPPSSLSHMYYSDFTWASWRPKLPPSRCFVQQLLKSNIKETSKIRTAGPLCEGTKPCNPSQKEGPVVRKACPCRDVIIIHAAIHYSDVIMSAIASQITSLAIFYSTVQSGADERKHQSSASLASVRGIHWWPVNFPHKRPITRKTFRFDDVIML